MKTREKELDVQYNEEVPVGRQVPLVSKKKKKIWLHFAWKLKYFRIWLISRQSCEVQNWAWSTVVLQIELINEP